MIADRYTVLAKQFQVDHGREPTTREAIALTSAPPWKPAPPNTNHARWPSNTSCGAPRLSSTWAAKKPFRRCWSTSAHPGAVTSPTSPTTGIAKQARIVVETVANARSSWQHTHVYAEAQRVSAPLVGRLTARWMM